VSDQAVFGVSWRPRTLPFGRQYGFVILILGLGIASSIIAFLAVQAWEHRQVEQEFQQAARARALALKSDFDAHVEALQGIRSLFRASESVERDDFHTFTRHDLAEHPGIQALEWIPRVLPSQRAAYEDAARRDGFAQFQFVERQSQGVMAPVATQDEYFPVYYVEPYAGNELALGFDLASNPTRLEALHRSRDTGEAVATARITLVQEAGDQFGFLVFVPIYRNGAPLETPDQRRENLTGFALGVFRIGDIVERSMAHAEPLYGTSELNIQLYDRSAPDGEQSLLSKSSATQADELAPPALHRAMTFEIAGRSWEIVVTPSVPLFSFWSIWEPWAASLGILMIAGLLSAYVLVTQRRTVAVDRRFRLTWLFVLVSVVLISVATAIVTRIVGNLAETNLVRAAEENAARDALHIQSMLRVHHQKQPAAGAAAEEAHTMVDGQHSMRSAQAVMTDQHPGTAQQSTQLNLDHVARDLPDTFSSMVEGLKVVKAELYDPRGAVVWSTQPGEIGRKEDCPRFEAVLGGRISSKLAYGLNLMDRYGLTRDFDVVRTCIPLRETAAGPVIGVLEINRDVTSDVVVQVGEVKSTVLRTTVATMGGLFLVLLGFIVTADVTNYRSTRRELSLIEAQLAERQLAADVLRDANENLESRVRERTSDLEEANEQLHEARDAALDASRAKSEFLASMSHEIRTPMNVILGMADLLSETPLNFEQEEYVRVFRKSGGTLLSLLNDILDFSKVEAGQLVLEKISFDPGELVEDTATFLAVRADEKGLKLSTHISPEVPTAVLGDPVRLRQVVTNLVANAVKFTEQGEVVVHVENDPETHESGSILFRVSDTGIGIPQQTLESIFDSFTQVDSSTTRQYGGTGLGLAISARLVELMGGRIWAESKVGEGSNFYFTARFETQAEASSHKSPPAVDMERMQPLGVGNNGAEEEALPPSRSADAPEDQRALRILLVEDFPDNRMLVESYLKGTPYRIDIAENGEIAVGKLKSGQYDLVLMDIAMPVMDGYTATREIRKWEKENEVSPTPIIAVTASALKEDKQKCLDAGCTAYLTKPVKKRTLLGAIREHAAAAMADA